MSLPLNPPCYTTRVRTYIFSPSHLAIGTMLRSTLHPSCQLASYKQTNKSDLLIPWAGRPAGQQQQHCARLEQYQWQKRSVLELVFISNCFQCLPRKAQYL